MISALTNDFSTNLDAVLQEIYKMKVEGSGPNAWSPNLRRHFNYFTPDEIYEAVLYGLVKEETEWLDIGCGHDLFPNNEKLAALLSSRCRLLVGIDPDDNIDRNSFLHERMKCKIEDYREDRQFDLITLRMVAEHITSPPSALAALQRLTRVGGRVVIYTVGKYSAVALLAAITPFALHRWGRRLLWNSAPEDTFPTVYRMNTRRVLRRQFIDHGFDEEYFFYLNDCNTLAAWRWSTILELSAERVFRSLRWVYPEFCILGIYKKVRHAEGGEPAGSDEPTFARSVRNRGGLFCAPQEDHKC